MSIKKAYLDTPDGQLHYVSLMPSSSSSSAHDLPVLLLHMSASSSQCFHSMMQMLSRLGYACYAPDMPGFGSSFDPTSDPPSIAWYADVYHHALASLHGFRSGCHVIGHHSGGFIGTELAARFPNFCRSLTVIGPALMSVEDRLAMSKTFLDPFNKPVMSGQHLSETWEYLQFEGLVPSKNLELMQREVLDHIRAWRGRSQIYACVWAYDMEAVLKSLPVDGSALLGLCARNDILWPYFENFRALGQRVKAQEIQGGNFGPDLDGCNIVRLFVEFMEERKAATTDNLQTRPIIR